MLLPIPLQDLEEYVRVFSSTCGAAVVVARAAYVARDKGGIGRRLYCFLDGPGARSGARAYSGIALSLGRPRASLMCDFSLPRGLSALSARAFSVVGRASVRGSAESQAARRAGL